MLSLKVGIAQMWKYRRIVMIFFLTNFIFGLLLMLPVRAALSGFASETLMGQMLAGRFSFDFLFEFFRENSGVAGVYAALFMVLSAIYWLLGLFLSGGAFAVLRNDQLFRSSDFWSGCGKFFGRFLRLVLWSLPVFVVLFLLQFVWSGIEYLIWGSDPYQYITFWGAWIKFGLRVISLLLFAMVLDYSRIYVVLTDENRMRVALWRGIKFVFGNFGAAFMLAMILYLAGLAVLALYNPIANVLSAPVSWVIVGLFVVQQLYMFWRMMLRLTLYASQMSLYLNRTEEAEPVTEEMSGDFGLQGA